MVCLVGSLIRRRNDLGIIKTHLVIIELTDRLRCINRTIFIASGSSSKEMLLVGGKVRGIRQTFVLLLRELSLVELTAHDLRSHCWMSITAFIYDYSIFVVIGNTHIIFCQSLMLF